MTTYIYVPKEEREKGYEYCEQNWTIEDESDENAPF